MNLPGWKCGDFPDVRIFGFGWGFTVKHPLKMGLDRLFFGIDQLAGANGRELSSWRCFFSNPG